MGSNGGFAAISVSSLTCSMNSPTYFLECDLRAVGSCSSGMIVEKFALRAVGNCLR